MDGVALSSQVGSVSTGTDSTCDVNLQDLHQSLQLPNLSWCDQSTKHQIRLCKISTNSSSSSAPLVITHSLTIDNTLKWSLFVHNREVFQKCSALASFPEKLTSASLCRLVLCIDHLQVCSGQPDHHFINMASAKKGIFKSKDGSISAIVDAYAPVISSGRIFNSTIRTVKCELLCSGDKCQSCMAY